MWKRASQSAFPEHWMLPALFLPVFQPSECWALCKLCSLFLRGGVEDQENGDAV